MDHPTAVTKQIACASSFFLEQIVHVLDQNLSYPNKAKYVRWCVMKQL